MGDTFKIQLSSDVLALNKKPLEEERAKIARSIFLQTKTLDHPLTIEESMERATDAVLSLRENEKIFLQNLLDNRSNMVKKLCEQRVLQDISATIENCEDSFIIKKTEWDDMKKSYENILEKAGKPNQQGQETTIPKHWLKMNEILAQLETGKE